MIDNVPYLNQDIIHFLIPTLQSSLIKTLSPGADKHTILSDIVVIWLIKES